MNKEVVIVSAVRTPIGSFMGSLSSVSAPKLGSIAIKGALEKIDLKPEMIQEVFMGNVVQAGEGQAPARQAALGAGIPENTPCTTINKVCASGMKAMTLAAQSIALGDHDIMIAGGMENMSQIPHYSRLRKGKKLGDLNLEDGLLKDGLIDAYDGNHMGTCSDLCADEYRFSREEVDQFAIQSYKRSQEAWKNGHFEKEVVPVEVPQRKGDALPVREDEEFKNIKLEKISQLRPVFTKNGTTTAANASTINDGAAALVLMSQEKADELGLEVLVRLKSYADAAQPPKWFTTSPAKALKKALKKAALSKEDIDYFELNEAFSVVGLANIQLLELDPSTVNINGGAVSLGHPLGCSGARIMVTLIHLLKHHKARFGAAGICNGGGGASAMIIENKTVSA